MTMRVSVLLLLSPVKQDACDRASCEERIEFGNAEGRSFPEA